MTKADLQTARELLVAKRYDEARVILEQLDNATARKWLAKLGERDLLDEDPLADEPVIKTRKPQRESLSLGTRLADLLISFWTVLWGFSAVMGFLQGTANLTGAMNNSRYGPNIDPTFAVAWYLFTIIAWYLAESGMKALRDE